jgi:hypothetical protein
MTLCYSARRPFLASPAMGDIGNRREVFAVTEVFVKYFQSRRSWINAQQTHTQNGETDRVFDHRDGLSCLRPPLR